MCVESGEYSVRGIVIFSVPYKIMQENIIADVQHKRHKLWGYFRYVFLRERTLSL
jgi:hypothetical protein